MQMTLALPRTMQDLKLVLLTIVEALSRLQEWSLEHRMWV